MSPIMELIKEANIIEAADPESKNTAIAVTALGFTALDSVADLQRLVTWIEDEAHHNEDCGCWFEKPCDCGLREIQSLLGE